MADKSQASLLANIPVSSFIQNVASRSPAPGGGSVAAFAGSLASALGGMVCRLTIGKKKYAEVEETMRSVEKDILPLRDKLRDAIDEDTFAFDEVMAAFDLPKSTPEESTERDQAILAASEKAAEVPLSAMKMSLEIARLLVPVAQGGNVNSISDVGVAGLCALTAFEGAKLNVLINIKEMGDTPFKARMRDEVKNLTAEAMPLLDTIKRTVEERLA